MFLLRVRMIRYDDYWIILENTGRSSLKKVISLATPRREAAASAIAGSIHAIIEQPITTPIEASITQTQVNGTLGSWSFG